MKSAVPDAQMSVQQTKPVKKRWVKLKRNWQLYLLILPVVIYFLVFKYGPMYGTIIAFKDFRGVDGIWGSHWVGLKHFYRFFDSFYFWRLMKNTIGIGLYELVVGTPFPIILALAINEIRVRYYKKFVQTITYAPHFLSIVVIAGMVFLLLDPKTGIVNHFLGLVGIGPIDFMTDPAWFKTVFVFSGAWQETGWKTIIYIAALAGINPELYEAAKVDGAGRLRRIWNIDLPGILPTIIILFILHAGKIASVGFTKVFLLQNPLNKPASDVIATHVYETGIMGAQYSYATAVGLFDAIINIILLIIVNSMARKASGTSLW